MRQTPDSFEASYVKKLLKGEGEARLVIGGSFGLHMHDGFLEDLLVPNVGLDQSLKARHNGICFFIELEGRETRENPHK